LNFVFNGHFIGITRLLEQAKNFVQSDESGNIPSGVGHINAEEKEKKMKNKIRNLISIYVFQLSMMRLHWMVLID
jgi:hypothetical protein